MALKKSAFLLFSTLLFLSVFSLYAQNINLSGTVAHNGNGISGAQVQLYSDENISTETGQQGNFTLTGDIISILERNSSGLTPSASLNGSSLKIVLTKSSPVSITVYNASGRMVQKINPGKLNAGVNIVSLPMNKLGTGVYMIAVNHEANRSLFKYVSSIKNSTAAAVSGSFDSGVKVTQEGTDSLLVSADGYHPTSYALNSYQQSGIYIELEQITQSGGSRLDNITRSCAGLMPSDVSGNNTRWASRYWDCCKPHCSWPGNTNNHAANCDIDNTPIAASEQTISGCQSGGQAYTCYDHAPYAVCEDLAYGFIAVNPGVPGADCGTCYKIQFDGSFRYNNGTGTGSAINGKMMIVMVSNIGYDVSEDQFDIMIPGGGLGAFDAGCAVQWGVDASNESLVGKRYGGFYSTCEDQLGPSTGWQFTMDQMKDCVRSKCENLFGNDPSMQHLYEGCIWYVDWLHAANNPQFKFEQVTCPQELLDLYSLNQ